MDKEEQMENKVVVHMKDGTIHKGVTQDFFPERDKFHLLPAEGGGIPQEILLEDMKALFFVKNWIGNREYMRVQEFDKEAGYGKKAVVTFHDGEQMWGSYQGYDEKRRGFFFFPTDPDDNNIRIYVVKSSIKKIEFVK